MDFVNKTIREAACLPATSGTYKLLSLYGKRDTDDPSTAARECRQKYLLSEARLDSKTEKHKISHLEM